MISPAKARKLVSYAIGGGVSTFIHYAVTVLLLYVNEATLLPANIVGFCSGFVFSYYYQSKFTFKQQHSFVKALKYFCVQISGLLAALFAANNFAGNDYFKTFVTLLILPLISFFLHSMWTFSSKNETDNT